MFWLGLITGIIIAPTVVWVLLYFDVYYDKSNWKNVLKDRVDEGSKEKNKL